MLLFLFEVCAPRGAGKGKLREFPRYLTLPLLHLSGLFPLQPLATPPSPERQQALLVPDLHSSLVALGAANECVTRASLAMRCSRTLEPSPAPRLPVHVMLGAMVEQSVQEQPKPSCFCKPVDQELPSPPLLSASWVLGLVFSPLRRTLQFPKNICIYSPHRIICCALGWRDLRVAFPPSSFPRKECHTGKTTKDKGRFCVKTCEVH